MWGKHAAAGQHEIKYLFFKCDNIYFILSIIVYDLMETADFDMMSAMNLMNRRYLSAFSDLEFVIFLACVINFVLTMSYQNV